MSSEIDALVARARASAEQAQATTGASNEQHQKLAAIAAEFESMLMVQVLKEMRRAGRWDDKESGDSLGAESLFETIDVELASNLARAQGFGLSRQLVEQFERMDLGQGAAPAALPSGTGLVVPGLPEMPRGVPPAVVDAVVRRLSGADAAVTPARRAAEALGTAEVPVGHVPAEPVAPAAPPPSAPTPASTPISSSSAAEPRVTSQFGWRKHPITGQMRFHSGVDLKAAYGQEVQSAGGGRVVFSGSQGGYGTTVMVEHADGTRTRYAHLSVALVGVGEQVSAGQALGRAGSSGRSTGPHLHFEVLGRDGRALDPLKHRVS